MYGRKCYLHRKLLVYYAVTYVCDSREKNTSFVHTATVKPTVYPYEAIHLKPACFWSDGW